MGTNNSKDKFREEEISEDLEKEIIEVFAIFDKDGSKEIDKNEALEHWKSNFAKLSAKEFFDSVDFDGNGEISEDEFIRFWKICKAYGHSENEIREELMNIRNGEVWVGFEDMPKFNA